MALEQFKTQVLLLHSEQSTLDSLSSGFNDRYTVHCATSGTEALTTLGETPIHIIVSAQELPGMSGLDALREAKKRSPDTIGILLAGSQSNGLEALVGDHEVFQIVRGGITPEALRGLIDNATRQVRLMALADSANDTTASVDVPAAEHIIMETSENGSTIISDGTGRLPILDPQKVSSATNVGTRAVDVLVLTKDEEFLATIRDSSRGLHDVHYANTVSQADEFVRANKIGVAVIDAAMVGSNVEKLTLHLRTTVPRLVAIVAGRRDDGEMLMDLINRGKVYRFLLKPVSPGRARLAVEASVKHHLEAPDTAFATAGNGASAGSPVKAASQPAAKNKVVPQVRAKAQPKAPQAKAAQKPVARPLPVIEVSSATDRLSDAFDGDDTSFTETMTGMVKSVGESIAGIRKSKTGEEQDTPEPTESTYSDSSGGSLLRTLKKLGIGAVALIAVAGLAFWLFSGTDESVRNEVLPAETAKVSEADPVFDATPPAEVQLASNELLAEARLARGAGQIYNPPGSNAIELYMAASAAAPGDSEIAAEMATVIQQALSNAESALLERRDDDAAAALDRIALAEPENVRLPFLNAQLEQIQLRNFLEEARLSIRETRFEDAAIALAGARSLDVAVTTEIETVEVELSDARSAQRADDVLAQAAASLEEGRLTEPSNDNARYYYELVLSNDPGNAAAIQGLSVIASQLVLQARTQIDRGNFNTAETLLADANKLDPSSTAVAESATALKAAREREARELREEADRQAASERRAAEERAAQQRAAEQQAAEQQAAEQRAAEQRATEQRAAEQQAAEQRAAERQAAEQTATSAAAATDNDEQTDDPVVEQSGENAAVVIAGVESAAVDNGAVASINETPAEPVAETATEAVEVQTAEPYVLNDIPINVSQLNRTKYVAPKYPRSAQRRRIAGWVDVVFIVTIDGLVRDITVRDSDPETTFVNAATKAVEDWEFEPVIEDGSAVEKRAAIRLMFAIE